MRWLKMKEGEPRLSLAITQRGLQSINLLGSNWQEIRKAIKLYLLIQVELQQFKQKIEKELKIKDGE